MEYFAGVDEVGVHLGRLVGVRPDLEYAVLAVDADFYLFWKLCW